jgi:hypothetical protein
MALRFDSEQLRIMNWRASSGDIAAVVGPLPCPWNSTSKTPLVTKDQKESSY